MGNELKPESEEIRNKLKLVLDTLKEVKSLSEEFDEFTDRTEYFNVRYDSLASDYLSEISTISRNLDECSWNTSMFCY